MCGQHPSGGRVFEYALEVPADAPEDSPKPVSLRRTATATPGRRAAGRRRVPDSAGRLKRVRR
jgi:hypothetical protein